MAGLVGVSLRGELRDLNDDYAALLDAFDLDGWAALFTEDARYLVTSRENDEAGLSFGVIYCEGIGMIRDRVVAFRETTVYEPRSMRHLVSGVRVLRADGDVVEATANFALVECLAEREPRLSLVGRYLDRLVRTEDGWRFLERRCVYDNYRIHTALVAPV